MADVTLPAEFATRLGAATERFHNAAQQHELTARMYNASQAELNAAERELRELGRAIAVLRQTNPMAAVTSDTVTKLRELLGIAPAVPSSGPSPAAPSASPLSPVAKDLVNGDSTAEAALLHMLQNPGLPVPSAQ